MDDTSPALERRLTAVLSADVHGYSRLMGDDEPATVKMIKAYRELMTGFISGHRGRVVDFTGDSLLAEFGSVVDAIECAVMLQQDLATRNAELPEERRMQFRIGINLGEVLVEGEQIYGDDVNIAARIQGLAEVGWNLRVGHGARSGRQQGGVRLRVPRRAKREEHCQAGDGLSPEPRTTQLAHERVPGRGTGHHSTYFRHAVHRSLAIRQHERRSGAGAFQRRAQRRPHHRTRKGLGVGGRGRQLGVQGHRDQRSSDRARLGRPLCTPGQRAKSRGTDPHHGPAFGRRHRPSRVGRALRP